MRIISAYEGTTELVGEAAELGQPYILVIDRVGRRMVVDVAESQDGRGIRFIPKPDWPNLNTISIVKDNRHGTVVRRHHGQ